VERSTLSQWLLGRSSPRSLARTLVADYLGAKAKVKLPPETQEMVLAWVKMTLLTLTLMDGFFSLKQTSANAKAECRFDSVDEVADFLALVRGEREWGVEQVVESCLYHMGPLPNTAKMFYGVNEKTFLTKFWQKKLGGTMSEPVLVNKLVELQRMVERLGTVSRSGLTLALVIGDAPGSNYVVFGVRVKFPDGSESQPIPRLENSGVLSPGDKVLVAYTEDGDAVIIGRLAVANPPTIDIGLTVGPRMPQNGQDTAPFVSPIVEPGQTPTLPHTEAKQTRKALVAMTGGLFFMATFLARRAVGCTRRSRS